MEKGEVIKFYEFIRHEKQSELRLIEPRWKNSNSKPIQKWVNNQQEFLDAIEKYDGKYNIYVGINERKENGDKDEDVEFITNIGHDIDAHGTDSSFQKAQEIAFKIKDNCIEIGYDEPLIICSGRGFWVIHHIVPIKNTEENKKKIKEFGKRIKEKYEVEGIELDSSVYNVSRIARVPGTLNISDDKNKVKAFIVNNPPLKEDLKLADAIIDIKLKTYSVLPSNIDNKNSCAFMDYCLTHEIPSGERHKTISRNMGLYISEHPDRELLREQYFKIQKGSETELDQWLKGIDEEGKDNFPFSCGELINFQKKYKIPIRCIGCKKYKDYQKQQKENKRIEKINKIQTQIDYNSLQKEVMTYLALKERDKATELIVKEIEKNNFIYTTKDDIKSEMWIYVDGIYRPEGKSYVKEITRKILEEAYTSKLFHDILNKIEADTYIEHDNFFEINCIDELPVENGILNIFTKELTEFNSNKIFFNKLPVKYNSESTCPKIDKFLSEILTTEEDTKVFYELGGFSLLKEYMFEKAFMFVGDGRNGKDKSLELIKRLIGIENCCSVPLSSLSPDSFIISMFFGKMVNIAGEINNKDLKETSTFKALTGRSLISAPRKFLNPITFQNHAKFIFACNDLPMVYDNSKGFWDRWVLLEFPYTFITQQELDNADDKTNLKLRNENIIEEITTPQEMEGLLNKFLEGLDRLIENKSFSTTKGSQEIKDLWIRKSNSFMAFCLDCIESDYNEFITKKDLRKKYHLYCKKHGVITKTDYVIKRTLEELFGVVEGRKMVFENPNHVWEGIKIKD